MLSNAIPFTEGQTTFVKHVPEGTLNLGAQNPSQC